jgi:hypothetical protein
VKIPAFVPNSGIFEFIFYLSPFLDEPLFKITLFHDLASGIKYVLFLLHLDYELHYASAQKYLWRQYSGAFSLLL